MDLEQNLKCGKCRFPHVLRTCRRVLNFTTGEVTFYCRNCRSRLLTLPFSRWNALQRAYHENPQPPPSERQQDPREAPREGRRRRRDRFRNRNRERPGQAPPRS